MEKSESNPNPSPSTNPPNPPQQPKGCPGQSSSSAGTSPACQGCPFRAKCQSGQMQKELEETLIKIKSNLANVKNIILILSGKGGVGKSTIASQLALSLSQNESLQIGILDIDLCGPNIPRMMGLENESIHTSSEGWTPIYKKDNLAIMSIAYLLQDKNNAVIWRGPRKNGMIKQFFTDVIWDKLDYLIIDTPPGTSDEHLSAVNYLSKCENLRGGIIVTTPQEVSLLDARKEIDFCGKVKLKVIGVVENMSGFECPCCKKVSQIFPANTGGAEKMCEDYKVKLIAKIPLDPEVLISCEKGEWFGQGKESTVAKELDKIKEFVINYKNE